MDNTTQIIVIVSLLAVIGLVSMFYAASTAVEIKNETRAPKKFEPRKVTVVTPSEQVSKKKKKKRYNKKKTTTVNTTQVEKRPVGRPKKSK